MDEIRRPDDDELEGFVVPDGDAWLALTVFHGVLGRSSTRAGAVGVVHAKGLPSLAERWYWYSRQSRTWRVVLPQEVRPGHVTVAVGYYSLPGVETATIEAADLVAGDRLSLTPPADVDLTDLL